MAEATGQTRAARATLVRRPSACNSFKMRQSVASSRARIGAICHRFVAGPRAAIATAGDAAALSVQALDQRPQARPFRASVATGIQCAYRSTPGTRRMMPMRERPPAGRAGPGASPTARPECTSRRAAWPRLWAPLGGRTCRRGLWRVTAPWGPADPREALASRQGAFAPPWPAVAIATGRHSIPYIRALRRNAKLATYTVILQDPRTGPNTADLIWVPAHDGLRGGNVITTITAPHSFSQSRLAELRRRSPGRTSRRYPSRAS